MMEDDFDAEMVDDSNNNDEEVEGDIPFLLQFIEKYKSLSELWDPNNIFYRDKEKRDAAVHELLPIYLNLKPSATEKDVRKKINSLRTIYRRERNKIIESTQNGLEKIYTPTKWTFYALQFLEDKELIQSIKLTDNIDFKLLPLPSRPKPKLKRKSTGKRIVKAEDADKNQPNNNCVSAPFDKWEAFGMSVAGDLRQLEGEQQAIAQKLISDVIFTGKFGRLSQSTSLMNYPIEVVSSSP